MSDQIVSFSEAKKIMASKINALKSGKSAYDVVRFEIKIHPIDEIAWIAAQNFDVKIFGANQDNTACIAGVGEAVVVKGKNFSSYKQIFSTLRLYLKKEYPYLQWYGGFSFDPKRSSDAWKEFGAYRFVIPQFELASDASSMIFCCNIVGIMNTKERLEILKKLESLQLPSTKPVQEALKTIKRRDIPVQKDWDKNVNYVLKTISKSGVQSLKKLVLARQTILSFSTQLDPWSILRSLFEVTPNSYHFCFQFKVTAFLGASPERLYRKYGGVIISEAIAGTSPRGNGISADHALKEELLASNKNQREHAFVVKAIDDGFKMICKDQQHAQKPAILTLGNGHHLITSFEGKLKDGVKEEGVVANLHPTPAVGGAPTKEALAMLSKIEGFDRGWYTGLIGYVGLDWSEFVVGIRSALVSGKDMTVYAGAGIVEGSLPQEEWQEVENKISNFIKIIQ